MRRIGLMGLLLGSLALGGVGIIAYQLGVSAGAASAAVAGGATVVYAAPWGAGFGFFPVIGLLFFGLLFLAVIGSIGRAAWGRGGPGRGPWMGGPAWAHGGPGAWAHDRPVPPFVQECLARWHAEAHGAPPAGSPDPAGSTGSPDLAPTDPA